MFGRVSFLEIDVKLPQRKRTDVPRELTIFVSTFAQSVEKALGQHFINGFSRVNCEKALDITMPFGFRTSLVSSAFIEASAAQRNDVDTKTTFPVGHSLL